MLTLHSRRELEALIDSDPALKSLYAQASAASTDDPGHDLAHLLRVAVWTVRLSEDQMERREAIAAALLHDLVNVSKGSPDRANASSLSAEAAKPLLQQAGFSEASVERVATAIREHSFSRGAIPSNALSRALQDADRLDALGAIGVLRVASTAAKLDSLFVHPEDPWGISREWNDRAYAVDHFFVKLLRLPDRMNTDGGKAEAMRRARWMKGFLEEFGVEIGEAFPDPPLD